MFRTFDGEPTGSWDTNCARKYLAIPKDQLLMMENLPEWSGNEQTSLMETSPKHKATDTNQQTISKKTDPNPNIESFEKVSVSSHLDGKNETNKSSKIETTSQRSLSPSMFTAVTTSTNSKLKRSSSFPDLSSNSVNVAEAINNSKSIFSGLFQNIQKRFKCKENIHEIIENKSNCDKREIIKKSSVAITSSDITDQNIIPKKTPDLGKIKTQENINHTPTKVICKNLVIMEEEENELFAQKVLHKNDVSAPPVKSTESLFKNPSFSPPNDLQPLSQKKTLSTITHNTSLKISSTKLKQKNLLPSCNPKQGCMEKNCDIIEEINFAKNPKSSKEISPNPIVDKSPTAKNIEESKSSDDIDGSQSIPCGQPPTYDDSLWLKPEEKKISDSQSSKDTIDDSKCIELISSNKGGSIKKRKRSEKGQKKSRNLKSARKMYLQYTADEVRSMIEILKFLQ